jgi:hypothetical protein
MFNSVDEMRNFCAGKSSIDAGKLAHWSVRFSEYSAMRTTDQDWPIALIP